MSRSRKPKWIAKARREILEFVDCCFPSVVAPGVDKIIAKHAPKRRKS